MSLPSWPCRFDPGHPLQARLAHRAGIPCGTTHCVRSRNERNVDKDGSTSPASKAGAVGPAWVSSRPSAWRRTSSRRALLRRPRPVIPFAPHGVQRAHHGPVGPLPQRARATSRSRDGIRHRSDGPISVDRSGQVSHGTPTGLPRNPGGTGATENPSGDPAAAVAEAWSGASIVTWCATGVAAARVRLKVREGAESRPTVQRFAGSSAATSGGDDCQRDRVCGGSGCASLHQW